MKAYEAAVSKSEKWIVGWVKRSHVVRERMKCLWKNKMIRSQWTSYLSSVLSASEMAGFLTAVLHAWLLLEEKGTILIQNSTLRTSLHNICIKRLITTSQWFYYTTKYNMNEFVRGKQGMWSNVLLSFCSTNTSLLHLTSCQPWSFEHVVLGQIWINAQRSRRANVRHHKQQKRQRYGLPEHSSAVWADGTMVQIH